MNLCYKSFPEEVKVLVEILLFLTHPFHSIPENIYNVKLCYYTIRIYSRNADFDFINADFGSQVVENKKFSSKIIRLRNLKVSNGEYTPNNHLRFIGVRPP
jgi:hypothetical protein